MFPHHNSHKFTWISPDGRVLKRIFGQKKHEVTEGWRKLHSEELHKFYSSPTVIRMTKSRTSRWVEHVARIGAKRNAYRILVGKPEGKRPLGRLKCRWMDNVKMDLTEIGWGGIDWIDLAKDRG
jgi:hypothetical protein